MLVSLGGAFPAMADSGDLIEVFIDARQSAYVTYQGVATDTSQQARDEMAGYATLEGISLVTWEEFRNQAQDIVAKGILKNEYPGAGTALGILAVLKANPGRPIAVTWNGGIATSFFDFQLAVETLEAYQENAETYEKSRTEAKEDDPLNPDVQIRAMLGS
ncbi:hypothetical protein [Magnetovibrio blakemorei]|uniref:hypothetical protein n=1 Tax=Magnetovibrio blakemorei TaxID=28181 RepID=UPI001112DC92|nr:hypothetical protein [Magnetovibrio blakemorei]